MPMIDLTMSRGVLAESDKAELMATLTRTLLKWEGAAPGNEAAESIAWTFLHEADLVTVAGAAPAQPRYRVVVGVPQGTVDDEAKRGLVAEVTEDVLAAERRSRGGAAPDSRDGWRVWVIIDEIVDGNWGGAGRVFRLGDILEFAGADVADVERRTARLRQPIS